VQFSILNFFISLIVRETKNYTDMLNVKRATINPVIVDFQSIPVAQVAMV
jgi:hypothetical protein